jgi:soluble lytic murein transglycosylase-like protein
MRFKKFGLALTLLAALTGDLQPAAASPDTDSRSLQALVDSHAVAHGIPASFARAIVRVESNWNPHLTGAAGEVGLMQIKHETARGLGFRGSREQLYDPATNIRWGMEYLAGAWKLAGGDHCGTVLRYQAGHGARSMTDAARAYCSRLRKAMASL